MLYVHGFSFTPSPLATMPSSLIGCCACSRFDSWPKKPSLGNPNLLNGLQADLFSLLPGQQIDLPSALEGDIISIFHVIHVSLKIYSGTKTVIASAHMERLMVNCLPNCPVNHEVFQSEWWKQALFLAMCELHTVSSLSFWVVVLLVSVPLHAFTDPYLREFLQFDYLPIYGVFSLCSSFTCGTLSCELCWFWLLQILSSGSSPVDSQAPLGFHLPVACWWGRSQVYLWFLSLSFVALESCKLMLLYSWLEVEVSGYFEHFSLYL